MRNPDAVQKLGERLDRYDLAVLAGGPPRAALVALISLAKAGTIDCGDTLVHRLVGPGPINYDAMWRKRADILDAAFVVRAVRQPGDGVHPVEKTVFDAIVAAPTTAGNVIAIRDAAATSAAMGALTGHLVDLGLVRARQKATTMEAWIFAAFVSTTMLFLVVTIFALATGAWWWYATVVPGVVGLSTAALLRKVTLSGHRVLAQAKRQHPLPPHWAGANHVGEVPDLGLLVSLHGEGKLRMLDPAFGFALGLVDLSDLESSCAC